MPEHLPAPTPHRAVYGFALYILFMTVFIIFICWLFIPQSVLEVNAGLFYLPDKYFALYIPVLVLFGTAAFAFFIYPSINLIITPELSDLCTISDTSAIYRCSKYINGSFCDKIIDESLNEIWPLDKLCLWHKYRYEDRNELDCSVNNNLNACDCLPNNCYLTKEKKYLTNLKTRNKIAPVRDLDIADVCNKIYGK